jgi:hypothetical protein
MNLLKTFTYSFCITFCVLTFCAFTILQCDPTLKLNSNALIDIFSVLTKTSIVVSLLFTAINFTISKINKYVRQKIA